MILSGSNDAAAASLMVSNAVRGADEVTARRRERPFSWTGEIGPFAFSFLRSVQDQPVAHASQTPLFESAWFERLGFELESVDLSRRYYHYPMWLFVPIQFFLDAPLVLRLSMVPSAPAWNIAGLWLEGIAVATRADVDNA